jgi:hypothetical protein
MSQTFLEIQEYLKKYQYYPANARVWSEGEAVYEGSFIERETSNYKYIVHWQRHYALNPFQLAETTKWEYTSLRDAVDKWSELKNFHK